MDSASPMERRQVHEYVRRRQEQLQGEPCVYCDWDDFIQITKYVLLLMCSGSLVVALLIYFFDGDLWVRPNPRYQTEELVNMFLFSFVVFGVLSILLLVMECEEKNRASRSRQSLASLRSVHIATPEQRPTSSHSLIVLPQEQLGETPLLHLPAESPSGRVHRPRGLFRSSSLPEEHMQVSPLETRFDQEFPNPAFLEQDIPGPSRKPQTRSTSRANVPHGQRQRRRSQRLAAKSRDDVPLPGQVPDAENYLKNK